MRQRKCTKCRTKANNLPLCPAPVPGTYWKHGIYPEICYPCNGTGFINIYTKEEKAQMQKDQEAFTSALYAVKDYALTIDDDARYLATDGLWKLKKEEPHRLTKLYASIANGRIDDVVRALIAYVN